MKTYIVINMPTTYRADLFNLLTDELGNNIHFCFIKEPAIDYKAGIGVYESEKFITRSKFYNHRNPLIRSSRFFIDLLIDRPKVIVNGGMPPRTLFLCLYCIIFRCKLITWWAGTELSERNASSFKRIYRKLIAKCAYGVMFYSRFALDYYRKLAPASFPYVILGNNTRNSSTYRKLVSDARTTRKDSDIIFLTVGFQTKRKNTVAILEALHILGSDFTNARLVIAGDGPELEPLRKLAQEYSLENIQFLGNVSPDEMLAVYANSDVFIQPSLMDQWPQTYNEASAAGLPVLISSTSGVYDKYTEEFSCTALFDPDDYHALASAMKTLADDKSLRETMGKKALEFATKYDANHVSRIYLEFIRGATRP